MAISRRPGGTSRRSASSIGDAPRLRRASTSVAIPCPIPFTSVSVSWATRSSKSGSPATTRAPFAKARTRKGFSPCNSISAAISSSASPTARRSINSR